MHRLYDISNRFFLRNSRHTDISSYDISNLRIRILPGKFNFLKKSLNLSAKHSEDEVAQCPNATSSKKNIFLRKFASYNVIENYFLEKFASYRYIIRCIAYMVYLTVFFPRNSRHTDI